MRSSLLICWWTRALRLCRPPRCVCARGSPPCTEATVKGSAPRPGPASPAHLAWSLGSVMPEEGGAGSSVPGLWSGPSLDPPLGARCSPHSPPTQLSQRRQWEGSLRLCRAPFQPLTRGSPWRAPRPQAWGRSLTGSEPAPDCPCPPRPLRAMAPSCPRLGPVRSGQLSRTCRHLWGRTATQGPPVWSASSRGSGGLRPLPGRCPQGPHCTRPPWGRGPCLSGRSRAGD